MPPYQKAEMVVAGAHPEARRYCTVRSRSTVSKYGCSWNELNVLAGNSHGYRPSGAILLGVKGICSLFVRNEYVG